MYDFIRKHKRWMLFIFLIMVIPTFVFFGFSGYNAFGVKNDVVAKVGGQGISKSEWDIHFRSELERIRGNLPAGVGIEQFESEYYKLQVLENLLQNKLLIKTASDYKLVVSESAVANELRTIPAIASFTTTEGQFDKVAYLRWLESQKLTPLMLENQIKSHLAINQVVSAVQSTTFVPKEMGSKVADVYLQEREVQLFPIMYQDFLDKVVVDEASIDQYYSLNQSKYALKPLIDAEYVLLDTAELEKSVTVSQSDINAYYLQNKNKYMVSEQRQASHILFVLNKDADAKVQNQVLEKANSVLKEVKNNPKDFAKLAKKYSEDRGSAEKGGDLGYFSKGMMVKVFEEAVFNLELNKVSELVQSEFGYHIIRVTGIRSNPEPSLKTLEVEIEKTIRKQQAQVQWREAVEKMSNLAYENPDDLQIVAKELHLPILVLKGVTKDQLPAPLDKYPKATEVVNFLFTPDAYHKKLNSKLIELSPNTAVVARVVHYTPERVPAKPEIYKQIQADWSKEQAIVLAQQEGTNLLKELKTSKPSVAIKWQNPQTISRLQTGGLSQSLQTQLFLVTANAFPMVVGENTPKGYVLAKVLGVKPQIKGSELFMKAYTRSLQDAEVQAYLSDLRHRYDAKVLVKN